MSCVSSGENERLKHWCVALVLLTGATSLFYSALYAFSVCRNISCGEAECNGGQRPFQCAAFLTVGCTAGACVLACLGNAGIMDPAYFVGRKEIITWINDAFSLSVGKIEDTASGEWITLQWLKLHSACCVCAFLLTRVSCVRRVHGSCYIRSLYRW